MSSISISSKLPTVGTTIFTVMSALANESQAINLSQGFPGFPCDKRLVSMVAAAMRKQFNQYAPMAGHMPLREKIAEMAFANYGAHYDPSSEITITSGATEAIYCAITALIQEGDEVLVFEPAYDSYIPAINLAGGVPVCISLDFPTYTIDWDKVKRLINQRTKAILLNSPHNPSGAIFSEEDLEQLKKIALGNNIVIISDEVYEHIIFDGKRHVSIAADPELAQQSVVISSFGKSLHVTGWKVGYAMAPAKLTKEIRKVHQFVTFSTSTPFQYAITEYLDKHMDMIEGLGAFYQRKRDVFLEAMQDTLFEPLGCSGTYFQLMSYKNITDQSDIEFSKWLTEVHKVACIPVSVFYRTEENHHVVRFCFAKEEKMLKEAGKRLKAVEAIYR